MYIWTRTKGFEYRPYTIYKNKKVPYAILRRPHQGKRECARRIRQLGKKNGA